MPASTYQPARQPPVTSQGPPDKRTVRRHQAPSPPANSGDRSGTRYPLKELGRKPTRPVMRDGKVAVSVRIARGGR
jgi:hypothetical protein